ncbi:Spermatogenesis-associated protein 31D1 [Manis javanica]|nr:Spermatogenesis-associated protein 31D1 [Manis javanica]
MNTRIDLKTEAGWRPSVEVNGSIALLPTVQATMSALLFTHGGPEISFPKDFLNLPVSLQVHCHHKHQGRVQRRWRRGTLKGCSYYPAEEEEKQQLIALLKSPLGQNCNITCLRQVLCPDPFCQVCNSTTVEVHRLLCPEVLEDATPSVSPLASTAPVTESSCTVSPADSAAPPRDLTAASLSEPSPPPPCILSRNPVTPLAEFSSPSPVCHTLPPELFPSSDSKFPVDCSQTQALAFAHLPPYDTQTVDPVFHPEATWSVNTISSLSQDIDPLPDLFQTMNPTDSCPCPHLPPSISVAPPPDCNLTMTPSKSISISLVPIPESSSPGSPGELFAYDPKTRGICHSSLSTSDCSWGQAHAKDLSQWEFSQEFLALHSSENSFKGDPAATPTESGNLSFLSHNALALLERQVRKRSDFLLCKEKEKKGDSFPKQLRPEYQLNSPGKMLPSVTDKHDLSVSFPFWNSKDKPEGLHVHKQPPYPKTLGSQLQQEGIQLFWGPPSLHSESLSSAAHGLGYYSTGSIFNTILNASAGQESPVLRHLRPLSLPEIHPQPQHQTPPQAQPLAHSHGRSQAHPPSSPRIPPSGPPAQTRICGVCFHGPQNGLDSLSSSEIKDLEWNVLQKQVKFCRNFVAEADEFQVKFCPLAPDFPKCKASQTHASVSVLPGTFPLSDEIQKKLEQHLQERLIQHRWGLPPRGLESLSLMMSPSDSSKISGSKRNHGISQRYVLDDKSSKNLNVGLSQPESFQKGASEILQPEKDVRKGQRQSPESGRKDLLSSYPEGSSYEDLRCDSEKELSSHMVSLSRGSGENEGGRELVNTPKVPLSENFEGQLPEAVHNSWHAMKQRVLPEKSHTQVKESPLPPSVDEDYKQNIFQDLSFIDSSVKQALEAHIKMFHTWMVWGLPPKVLESIETFKSENGSSYPLSYSDYPSSADLVSGANSKSEGLQSKPHRGSSKSPDGGRVRTPLEIVKVNLLAFTRLIIAALSEICLLFSIPECLMDEISDLRVPPSVYQGAGPAAPRWASRGREQYPLWIIFEAEFRTILRHRSSIDSGQPNWKT